MARETVYFISTESGPIKIGKAKNVVGRLKTLQTSSPEKLSVMGVYFGPQGIEHSLHGKFADLRIKGEWYRREESLLSFITDNSFPLETATRTSREIVLAEKNKALEIELLDKKNKMRDEITLEVANNLYDQYVERTKESMDYWITLAQVIQRKLHQVEQKYQLTGMDYLSLEIRRTVDEACAVKWKISKQFLECDRFELHNFGPFNDSARAITFELLKTAMPKDLRNKIYLHNGKIFKKIQFGDSY